MSKYFTIGVVCSFLSAVIWGVSYLFYEYTAKNVSKNACLYFSAFFILVCLIQFINNKNKI